MTNNEAILGDEGATIELNRELIKILLELRGIVRTTTSVTFTQPTDNPKDIITGLNKQGVITDEIMAEAFDDKLTFTGNREKCSCPFCMPFGDK
jgi:hypothetical protein